MAGSELRQRLSELAQAFVEGVLAAIRTASLSDVASEVAVSLPVGARMRAPRGTRGGATRPEATHAPARTPTPTPTPTKRKLKRRAGGEIEQVRNSIVRVLEKAGGPVGASDIARQLGERTESLAFPMAQLRKAGRVHKEGERTQATYTLVHVASAAKASKKRKG